MGKEEAGIFADIRFNLFPVIFVITDFFTIGANGEQVAQLEDFLFLRFFEGISCFAILCYIDTTSDVAHEYARVIVKGDTPVKDPAVDAIVSAEAVFHFEDFPAGKMFGVYFEAAVEIVGVNTFCPSVAGFLFHGPPGEGQPDLVEIIAFHCGGGSPDHNGSFFDEELVFFTTQLFIHRQSPVMDDGLYTANVGAIARTVCFLETKP